MAPVYIKLSDFALKRCTPGVLRSLRYNFLIISFSRLRVSVIRSNVGEFIRGSY